MKGLTQPWFWNMLNGSFMYLAREESWTVMFWLYQHIQSIWNISMCWSMFISTELIDSTGHVEAMVEDISSAARIYLLKKILSLREVIRYILILKRSPLKYHSGSWCCYVFSFSKTMKPWVTLISHAWAKIVRGRNCCYTLHWCAT